MGQQLAARRGGELEHAPHHFRLRFEPKRGNDWCRQHGEVGGTLMPFQPADVRLAITGRQGKLELRQAGAAPEVLPEGAEGLERGSRDGRCDVQRAHAPQQALPVSLCVAPDLTRIVNFGERGVGRLRKHVQWNMQGCLVRSMTYGGESGCRYVLAASSCCLARSARFSPLSR